MMTMVLLFDVLSVFSTFLGGCSSDSGARGALACKNKKFTDREHI